MDISSLSIDTPEPLGPFATQRPVMQGRYLIRNAVKARMIAIMDAGLALASTGEVELPDHPLRILVSNWGHLGDVVTTFGAIGALRERYPQARIGIIVGSWGRVAVQGTGLVDDIHVVDHWAVNRSNLPMADKRRKFRDTRAVALREMKAIGYQLGIDFYPFFPPAHPLFRKAGIPVRVGYESGGFGPLLTHPVRWSNADRPMGDQYRDLLNALTPQQPFAVAALRPRLSRDTLAPLPQDLEGFLPYIVLHPGAGAAYKDWGFDNWRDMIALLQREKPGFRLVVTGAGQGEVAMAAALVDVFPELTSMAGRANWESFVSIVAHAALVICPDTATGHVAALFDIPVIGIFTGTNNPVQWGPYSDKARIIVQPVLCAPCNRAGCDAMACIRDIVPNAVMTTAQAMLADNVSVCEQAVLRPPSQK